MPTLRFWWAAKQVRDQDSDLQLPENKYKKRYCEIGLKEFCAKAFVKISTVCRQETWLSWCTDLLS